MIYIEFGFLYVNKEETNFLGNHLFYKQYTIFQAIQGAKGIQLLTQAAIFQMLAARRVPKVYYINVRTSLGGVFNHNLSGHPAVGLGTLKSWVPMTPNILAKDHTPSTRGIIFLILHMGDCEKSRLL